MMFEHARSSARSPTPPSSHPPFSLPPTLPPSHISDSCDQGAASNCICGIISFWCMGEMGMLAPPAVFAAVV